jgi:hypothetical protein
MGRNNKRGSTNTTSQKAKSGAKIHQYVDSDKGLFIGAWKIIDGQMANIKIFMTEKNRKTGTVKSKTGKIWVPVTMVVTIPTKQTSFCNGLMNVDDYRCYFKDWNWICNPKAKNGGYIGKHISKDYN